jgi:hypothetical protein
MEWMILTGSLIAGSGLLGIVGTYAWWFYPSRAGRAAAAPPPDTGHREMEAAGLRLAA